MTPSQFHGPVVPVGNRDTHDGIAGHVVTEVFDYDGGRQVTAYIPADPCECVVFAGDGQLVSGWGGLLEKADVPTTMIVGAHRSPDETLRLHEYSPRFDPVRFAAHERFFVDDVRDVDEVTVRTGAAPRTNRDVRGLGEC